ncbi:uncharacterized protein LOC131878066 [Tigriopus californicus]|uniref:uncharacterized protein LOC131878066 n=1 Tax=Tigriopus californicus TaxID=6832 RepID=UPI0027DAA3B4|nr:uncharacterized protein LOC131878066 [Tigriopus californicus]
MDEIHLHQIQEKTVIGSYSNGLIPIRSASFSSSEPYKKRNHSSEANEDKPLRTIISPHETDKAVIEKGESAIISEELEAETTGEGTESDHGSTRTPIKVKVTSVMNEGQNDLEAQDDVVDAGGKSREKMLEHFKANATKLSRSSSWKSPPLNLKEAKRASSKVKDCKLPASLQHLQLEASNCPSSMKISIKPFERACPAHTDTVATSSSREDTLSPAVSGKSFGESTETLINIDETVAFGPKNGSNLATNVNALIPAQKASTTFQEDSASTNRAIEVSEQTPYSDALLDQFTQKGLIAKEIKVAEVIEVPNDSETWDAGEESMYGSYATEFAHFSSAGIMGFLEKVEVDEMVTYNPDLRLLQPINAAELIQEGQSTLHMPILQQPQLYYGGEYPGGYVVQRFDPKQGRRDSKSRKGSQGNCYQDSAMPDLTAYDDMGGAVDYGGDPIMGLGPHSNSQNPLRQHRASIIEIGEDNLESGSSMENQAEELMPIRHHYHQIVPNEDGRKAMEPKKRSNLFPSTSMSSDEMDYYGMPQTGSLPNNSQQSQWNLQPFDEESSMNINFVGHQPKQWEGAQGQSQSERKRPYSNERHLRFDDNERPQLVDLDWDLLGEGDEKADKSEFLVQAQPQPRISEPASNHFGPYSNHHHEYNDSDGMTPDPRYPRQKHPGGPDFPYINFESDNDRYHDFSGDEEDTHLHFESHGTIQDAIKRQQRHEEEHHTVVGGQKVSSSGDMNSNAMIMRPPTGGPRQLVRLPRGRHPLRGPFGQMLDAQMSKSELTKKNLYYGDSDTLSFIQELSDKGSSPAASEPDVSMSFHPHVRQVKSDSVTHWITTNNDLSKSKYGGGSSASLSWNDGSGRPWPQIGPHRQALQPRSATMVETNQRNMVSHPQELAAATEQSVDSAKITHIRTRSSPSKLIGDLDLQMASNGLLKKRSDCNFADINQEELTVHQDLLVSRNPRLEETKANSQDNGMKSSSFRRRGDTRTLIVKELYNVEKSYVESLQFLVARYYRPLKNHDRHQIISSVLADDIFFQIPEILSHHESFMNSLKSRLEHWDPKQTIGDWFLDCFSRKPVIDTYTAFIRNVKRADEAIRIARQTKPAFDRFLQDMRRERRGERLSLADLLAKPHQRIPRYRLLIQRLLEHTETEHADFSLLRRAEREIHELALKISTIQKETNEQEHRQKVLRQLELSIQGLNANDLGSPTRSLIQYDLVTMTNGPWSTKDRCLFLFNDLLIITSISKRAARDVRRGAPSLRNLSQLLDNSRQKLWMYVSLEEVEISKAKEEHLKKIMRENRDIEEDINTLRMIGDATSRLHCPHKELDDLTRQLMGQLNRQLAERQNADTQQAMYLDLNVTTSDGIETISLIFADAERRSQWEDTFNEIKQNLVRHDDKKAPPDFLNLIPIRKTRSGLQFTCAAPTLGLNAHKLKDVWVCNSDGYVGQVCVLSLLPEPTVICCNGVCNARILSIVSVPSLPRSCEASVTSTPALRPKFSDNVTNNMINNNNAGETSSVGSYEKPSPPVTDLADSSPNVSNPSQLDSSSASDFELRRHHLREVVLESSSSSDEDEDIIADEESGESTVKKSNTLSASIPKESSPCIASSPIAMKSSSSPTPDVATSASKISSTLTSILNMSSSPTTSATGGGPDDENQGDKGSQSSQGCPNETEGSGNFREDEECQATMWLGTEDGHIHVYNCSDNIRIKKNKEKFLHTAPVSGILYLDNRVYAALGNGNIVVYSRAPGGLWDKVGAKTLSVGTTDHPVSKMITIGSKIWCSAHNTIKVIDSVTLDIETSFTVDETSQGENAPCILAMVHSGWAVWIAMEQSAVVKAYHIQSLECICQVKVTSVVNKVLAGCDEIIRQHKAACLRITALLTCKDILWIGTSAGVIVTMRLPHLSSSFAKIAQLAPLIGNPHGHSGHVRFLTCVEMTPEVQRTPFGKTISRFNRPNKGEANTNNASAGQHKMLVISGGDGYENFTNNSNSEIIGREDSTNHLLLWQV